MLVTLFDHIPGTPIPVRTRKRRAPSDSHLKYTRYPGKGRLEMIRIWLTGYGSINCGLYDRELLPVVRRKILAASANYPSTPIGLWRATISVLDSLRAKGILVPDVLPMYVRRCPGGYSGKVTKSGRRFECPGPFDTPEEAHLAMTQTLAMTFPQPNKTERVGLDEFLPAWTGIV